MRVLPNGQVVPLESLQLNRNNIAKEAFVRTNVPTMSLEEFHQVMAARAEAEEEAEHSHPHPRSHQIDSEPTKYDVESDDDDDKTLEARRWDDWKDDNPKGSGRKKT